MEKPIKIIRDGITHELLDLLIGTMDKRQRWQFDQDYISKLVAQLSSSDPKKVTEAEDALLFLNASVAMEMDGNFNRIKELGVSVPINLKKEIVDGRNGIQRDFASNNYGVELTDYINPEEYGPFDSDFYQMKKIKKSLRKKKVSVAKFREDLRKNRSIKDDEKTKVKKYSPEEIAKFQEEYNKRGNK